MQNEIRFELVLTYFPSDESIRQGCVLLYKKEDRNLIASMSSTPYTLGRSFSREEQEALSEQLKILSIGFKFTSKPPFDEVISFDPRIEAKEELSNQSLKIPWIAIGSFLVLVGLILGLFYFLPKFSISPSAQKLKVEQTKPSTSKEGQAISTDYDAKLTKLQPKVEFRAKSQLLWKSASEDQKLEENDSLRTYSNAFAILRYRDGSYVRIKENTLLIVGQTEASDENGTERELELKDGSLQARLQASEELQSLSIKTPEGTLKISNQYGKEPSAAQIQTSFKNGQLEVEVSEGQVNYLPSSKSEKPVQVSENKKLTKSSGQEPKLENFTPSIELITPTPNSKWKLRETGNKFTFKWESIGDGVEYVWSIYSDSAAQNLLLSQRTQATEITLNYLDIGSSYWRVEAKLGETLFVSPLRQLYVEKNNN